MEDFIRLYDAALEFSLKGMSLEEKYEALGLPSTHGWTIFKVREGLRDKIVECIQVEEKEAPHVLYTDLLKCREYWFYKKQILNTSKYDLYIKAITHLHDSFGSRLKYLVPFSEKESWLEALKYLKCMIEDDTTGGSNLNHVMVRQIDRSRAIKRLMKDGLNVKFNDKTMEMEVERLFFNSGFYSIEQKCYILSQSADKEEFIKNLVDIKYMTFGTKDYWAEIDYRLKK